MNEKKKKKFNGKYLTFGIVMVFALALGSALLVPYLSNTVNGSVDVESPMLITLDCPSENCLEGMFGGETLEISDTVTKLTAGNTGDMNVAITIYNFDGEGIDIDWEYTTSDGTIIEFPLDSNTVNGNTVYSFPDVFNWDDVAQGYDETGTFLITANPALDTREYDMSAKIVPIITA